MDLEKLKEEFEHMKDKYRWTDDKERGHFIIPKKDMEFFLDGLDFVLQQQQERQKEQHKKNKKQRKEVE